MFFRVLAAGGVVIGGRFTPAAAGAFEFRDASFQFSDAPFLQKEDLAFQIGETGGLRDLHIFEIFEGLEAS
jgi:hypothetical protein